jgi:hypothetical protein
MVTRTLRVPKSTPATMATAFFSDVVARILGVGPQRTLRKTAPSPGRKRRDRIRDDSAGHVQTAAGKI